ncbi:MAG: thiamine phosphate synthase [Gemmataceae bacterium]
MLIENSPGLDKALRWARRFAAGQGAETVQPVHLLDGLLVEEEGMPWRMLQEAGIAVDTLRPAYEEEGQDEEIAYPISARVRHVLKRAQTFARWHSAEGTLTTDLVLLALLDLEEGLRDRLASLGLDWQAWQDRHDMRAPDLRLDEPLQLDEPVPSEVARILDAAGNRAREALRVLEDFARFVLDDAFLTRELKETRHDLVAALAPLALPFLRKRETEEDVGVDISTPRERRRDTLQDVVRANAKRLQEALRSLEEFGKVHSSALGEAMERLRYRAYTIEKALARDPTSMADARLYVLVTEKLCRASLIGTVREALEGGADVIQLREKETDDRALLAQAREIRALTRDHAALFIVNDRPDLALLADADGVHLGQDDLPVRAARRILGPSALIGVSTHDLDQVHAAIRAGADYIGIGPTFPSQTKDFPTLAGLDFIEQASRETSLSAFALGGITLDNVEQVLARGARRIAVSHAICAAPDPAEAARRFKALLQESK